MSAAEEEARAAAYRQSCITRAAARSERDRQLAGSPGAYIALYERMTALRPTQGVYDDGRCETGHHPQQGNG